jgi:hypothetical protein
MLFLATLASLLAAMLLSPSAFCYACMRSKQALLRMAIKQKQGYASCFFSFTSLRLVASQGLRPLAFCFSYTRRRLA